MVVEGGATCKYPTQLYPYVKYNEMIKKKKQKKRGYND